MCLSEDSKAYFSPALRLSLNINAKPYKPRNILEEENEVGPGFYDNYQLKFEGEYFNGERNGKGINIIRINK